MSDWRSLKRFYDDVTVEEHDSGYCLCLDGKQVKTPAQALLSVESRRLAEEAAKEWQQQGEAVDFETMPLSRLSATAIDRVARYRSDIETIVMNLAGTDLLCYWAEDPQELVDRQAIHWQPLLDWIADTYGAPLEVCRGIIPINQPANSIERLRAEVSQLDEFTLTGISSAAVAAGSLVLALALFRGRLNVDATVDAALLDERFQMERWGQDSDAMARHRRIADEIAISRRFLDLIEA